MPPSPTSSGSPSTQQPSRREVLRGGVQGLAALALVGCATNTPPVPATPSTPMPSAAPVPPAIPTPQATAAQRRTTLQALLVGGDKLDPAKPYRRLALGDPQKLVVREDLCAANPARSRTRKALLAFGHITDTHILDPTSPAHTSLEFFRNPAAIAEDVIRYFRPQDSLTVQVMDAMVRKLNAVGVGPLTSRPFDFYISTGDSSDNRGKNEISAFIKVMNGEKASAFAFPGSYEGLQTVPKLPASLSRFIWQPAPTAGSGSAVWQDRHGFPRANQVLTSAARIVSTEGAAVPWYSGFGNHDQLAHGGTGRLAGAFEAYYATLAASGKIVLGLPAGYSYTQFMKALNGSTQPQLESLVASLTGPTVPASQARAPATKRDFINAHLRQPGPHGPAGHGFTAQHASTGLAYYSFAMGSGLMGIMLDTTDPSGGGKGSLDAAQAAWLEAELEKVSAVSFTEQGKRVTRKVTNKLVVLFSHHPGSVFGPLSTPGLAAAVDSPEAVAALLGRYPNVIAWINGHLHRNKVWAHRSTLGEHGYWEINTASHIDFPQQCRTVEIIDNRDGTLSIAGVLLDHSDAMELDYTKPFTTSQLAAFSAELALNTPNPNAAGRRGSDKDQNVELLLRRPF